MKRLGKGCLIVVAVILVIGVIGSIVGGGSQSATQTASESSASQNTDSTSESVTSSREGVEPTAEATIEATPAPTGPEVVFGNPLNLSQGGLNSIAVPVTNSGATVKSFTVKATYKDGDTITATAVGAVNDLLPGQTRPVTLLSQETIPDGEPRIDVDTMLRDTASTSGSEVASKLTFGPPKVSDNMGMISIDVEVTNGDDKPHTFTIVAMFRQGDKLVGVGTGAVNDLAAGQTKTATLLVQGSSGGEAIILVDTIVQ